MIVVFAYGFPHRKTHDFLCQLALCGYQKVTVLAAPYRHLEGIDRSKYFENVVTPARPLHPREICSGFGYSYFEMEHSNLDGIKEVAHAVDAQLGIVSGARILRRSVIDIFPGGVVNFHPGMLPETSGLDAFYYTIKRRIEPGVTAHFIDGRVDAGFFFRFDPVFVGPSDLPGTVLENTYQKQIESLRHFLDTWKVGDCLLNPIDRPIKNPTMQPSEKRETLLEFPSWRAEIYTAQMFWRLTKAAEYGDVKSVRSILDIQPALIERRTPEGWTPLIIAAFHQRLEVVVELLSRGANPNASGRNGTTVLMYAKTALMNSEDPDTSLLDLLVRNGADPSRRDIYGKSIRDYVQKNAWIAEYISRL